jgi:hypothetical protein
MSRLNTRKTESRLRLEINTDGNGTAAALDWLAMKSYVASLLACASLGVAVLVGCAEGSQAEIGEANLNAAPPENTPPDEKVSIPPPSQPDTTIDQTSSSSGGDGGASSSSSSSSSSSGGAACAAVSPCSAATDMGDMSGDTNADVKATDGSTSQWIRVHLTENDHALFSAKDVKALATLTSPPGTTFELYTYVASSDGPVECSAVTGTGNTYNLSMNDNKGSSDSRWVTYEVRHVSGPCDATKKWTLKIEGNK